MGRSSRSWRLHIATLLCLLGYRGPALVARTLHNGRWVAELQQEHLVAVKKAVLNFPVRPFSRKHTLFGVVHPLHEWANTPTPLPSVQQLEVDEAEGDEAEGGDAEGDTAVVGRLGAWTSLSDDDDDDDDNCLSESSSSHDYGQNQVTTGKQGREYEWDG